MAQTDLMRDWDVQLAAADGDDVAAAVGILRCSQRSHSQWLDYLTWHREHEPEEYAQLVDAVGPEEFHQRCVDEYDNIIAVIDRLAAQVGTA